MKSIDIWKLGEEAIRKINYANHCKLSVSSNLGKMALNNYVSAFFIIRDKVLQKSLKDCFNCKVQALFERAIRDSTYIPPRMLL